MWVILIFSGVKIDIFTPLTKVSVKSSIRLFNKKHKDMSRLFQLVSLLFISCQLFAQDTDILRQKLQQIVSNKNAIVGVSIIGNKGKDTISLHGDTHCPLQSVFKFHIAIAILSQIDKGKWSLNQKITVKKQELLPDLWSPLRDDNPNGGSFTIVRLIQYAICQSDNVACDVLIRLLGSPKAVEDYVKQQGIKDIAIQYNEEDMQSSWDNMYENWTTPKAASETLQKFYDKGAKRLSNKRYKFLWKTMKETVTGADRLKGLLPKGTIVMHKTGTSGTNKEGLTPAINDIGIVFLPNGQHFIISVFVTNSKENNASNEKIIAEITKTVWDYYVTKR